jgi:hypothetical protein
MKSEDKKIPTNIFRKTKEEYGSSYDSHVFKQYKLYIEMADRVSQRRMLANSLFVSVNSALIAGFMVLIKEKIINISIIGILPFFAVLLLCYIWWRTVSSYRQLNSGKFKIVHQIEKQLPLGLYDAEWEELEKGNNPKIYKPISHVENLLPFFFAILYLIMLVSLGVMNKADFATFFR